MPIGIGTMRRIWTTALISFFDSRLCRGRFGRRDRGSIRRPKHPHAGPRPDGRGAVPTRPGDRPVNDAVRYIAGTRDLLRRLHDHARSEQHDATVVGRDLRGCAGRSRIFSGISIGCVLMVLLLGLGLASVIGRLPWLYTLLHIVSTAYLLYLAWRIATSVGGRRRVGACPAAYFPRCSSIPVGQSEGVGDDARVPRRASRGPTIWSRTSSSSPW